MKLVDVKLTELINTEFFQLRLKPIRYCEEWAVSCLIFDM